MEPGKLYQVPHVRALWVDDGTGQPRWWPVIGPAHDDAEIIGFEPKHWHVDFRFLDGPDRERTRFATLIPEVFVTPISRVIPDLPGEIDCPHHDHTQNWVDVDDLPHEGIPQESYFRVLESRYRAEYPVYPPMIPWLGDLEAAYRDHRLKPGLICPHRGAGLSGIEPVDGIITCPLHGLDWCAETGRLVPLYDIWPGPPAP